MNAYFLVILLSSAITESQKCGFRIRSYAKGPSGQYCYLDAGHLADGQNSYTNDKNNHGLNWSQEYNLFWRCTHVGYNNARVFFWEAPLSALTSTGSRLFTILPSRYNTFDENFVESDYTEDQGHMVGNDEYNAKVQRVTGGNKVRIHKTGTTTRILTVVTSNGILKLERALTGGRYYELVTGAKVGGYEAKFQYYKTDPSSYNNYVQIINIPCDDKGYSYQSNEPNPYYLPEPQQPQPNNPSSIFIELPVQETLTVIMVLLAGLILVNFVCCIYRSKYSSKGKNHKYKSVKFDSETDTV